MNGHGTLSRIVLACAVAAGVAACGSSGGPAAPATSSQASSAATAPASGSATQQIKANWIAFFSAKTPTAKRISLLQDGQAFAKVIRSQASSGLASQASAKVTKVTLVSSKQAKVGYSILVSGQAALPNQTGVAVLQDGTWKVGVASFCGLLTVENGGKTSSLPAACKTSG